MGVLALALPLRARLRFLTVCVEQLLHQAGSAGGAELVVFPPAAKLNGFPPAAELSCFSPTVVLVAGGIGGAGCAELNCFSSRS
ncbi:hypothetical protein TNCV_2582971 [Trichonephila clavipes]|nr:hypothetical protein TNCV_2582971 [Trichonephila clavipes]